MDNGAGTFDMLNDALFAQLGKLQSIDPGNAEQMDRCIEQSRAVSQLAGNIIANHKAAVDALRFYEQAGMDAGGLIASAPRMLGGGR